MATRSAILISCSVQEAGIVRERAAQERRGISSYVLNILMRAVELQEKLRAQRKQFGLSDQDRVKMAFRSPGPRSVFLLRCSVEEARRIRRVAKTRDRTISGFVLSTLQLSWHAKDRAPSRVVRG